MSDLLDSAPHSYRADPNVPAFDDRGPLVVVDGQCALCSFCARLIARFDRRAEFRICTSQSALGRALLLHHGLAPDDPESWLYLADGRGYTSLDAIVRAGRRLGGPGWLLQPLRMLPRTAQERAYRWVARNRYRLFGRADLCGLPNAAVRARLIE